MMMTSRIMPACFCLFLSACGLFLPSAPEAVTYYELDSGACEAKQTANGPLSESRLTLHSTYVTGLTNSRKIVFSREPGTRASYQYAVWVEPPAQRLPQLLLRRLECEGIYRTVTLRSSLAAADLALNLEL